MSLTPHRYLRPATAAAAVVLALVAGACTAPGDTPQEGPGQVAVTSTATPEPAPEARVKLSLPTAQARPVPYTHMLVARAVGGDLTSVTLTTGAGERVPGKLVEKQSWRPGARLLPTTRYRLRAEAVNADGTPTVVTRSFVTTSPAATDLPAVTPLAGSTVGVGHPVVVYFDYDVEDRAAVEERLHVKSSRPVKGSWGWLDDRSVAYRPKEFWPAHTDVSVHVDLAKTKVRPGVWVMEDRTIDFRVGRSQVLRISNTTLDLSVVRDGKVTRTMPVSMGKPGFTTRSGVKVIMTQERSRRMDSATVGIGGSEAYDLVVPYALRITATGEFLHGAPWSEWAQGSRNVSHGCTNVSLANAIWLYHNTLIGDPVVTEGTGRPTEEWNGLGGVWNADWSQWQARSALDGDR